MRNIVEATEVQREALQRSSVTITTEILPVVSKLEGTVEMLEALSKKAGGILGTASADLQRTSREMQSCLDEFSRTQQTVSPEVEKSFTRFEAVLKRLPDQIEASLTRLMPLSDTVGHALDGEHCRDRGTRQGHHRKPAAQPRLLQRVLDGQQGPAAGNRR
jgi:hypothetical protein